MLLLHRHIIGILLITLSVTACVEPYSTPDIAGDPNFLVVDGFINATENKVTAKLSRAVSISSAASFAPITEDSSDPIQVRLEDEFGNQFPLARINTGEYEATSVSLQPQNKYRLYVSIPPDEEYASDYIEIKETPPIEEIHYDVDGDNLRILLNTSDPTGRSKYYRWTFAETFEYTSYYYSLFKMQNHEAVPRKIEEEIYRCYKTFNSTNIMIASSTELSSDVIRNFHLHSIPSNSQKLQLLYSINVKQFALSEDAYSYWFDLFQTTQNLGGLFDPMPGEVKGNFRSLRDPSRTVIGFFSGSSVQEKRIFIAPEMLPNDFRTFRHPYCETDTILTESIPTTSENTLLIVPATAPNSTAVIGFTTSESSCIDCRIIHHGVTEKPPFWP